MFKCGRNGFRQLLVQRATQDQESSAGEHSIFLALMFEGSHVKQLSNVKEEMHTGVYHC